MNGPTETLKSRFLRLAPELDELVAQVLAEEAVALLQPKLVTAKQVAERFGLERDWVYRNAHRLGAVVIGTGQRRPRKRFYLHRVVMALDAMAEPVAQSARAPAPGPTSRRRARRQQLTDACTPSGNPRLQFKAA
jgi:hypothetical protein